MAINFPNSPSDNDTFDAADVTFIYDSAKGTWTPQNEGSSAGVTVYATIDDLPLSGVTEGKQALVDSTDTLYIWSDNGWYKIALVNTTPSISNVASSYTLSTDGTATVIDIVAEDPEGIPITYSIASDTSGDVATVTQGTGSDTNQFTITPSTNTSLNGSSFSLTFRASDGVNIATAASTFSLNFITVIDKSNYTTALITTSGTAVTTNATIIDSSTSSHTITVNGNTNQTTFSPYRSGGYSAYFDGTGDYLVTAADSSMTVGTGQFTLECWFRTEQDTQQTILALMTSSSNVLNIFYYHSYDSIGIVDSGFLTGDTGSGDNNDIIELNQWYHLALVRDATTMYLYIDGALKWSASNSTNYNNDNIWIGRNQYGNEFKGHITDVRLVKGTAITPATGGPTERLTAVTNTSLLTCHLPYIADGSTNSHSITRNGNTKTEPFAPYDYSEYSASSHGGSYYFDETGDWITVSASSDFQLSDNSNPVTVECWVWIDPTEDQGGIWELKGSSTDYVRVQLKNTDEVNFKVLSSGSIEVNSTTSPLTRGMWHHVAWVRESDGTYDVYVDGKSVLNGTVPAINDSSTWELNIGNKTVSTDQLLLGHIADFRWINGTAVYTADFTPPTAPLTAITNTKLLLSGTNGGIIDKAQYAKKITFSGDPVTSTTQAKYLTRSMHFDGNDYLQMDSQNIANFGTSDFTAEGWFWVPSLPGSGTIATVVDARDGGTNTTGWTLGINQSGQIYIYSGSQIVGAGGSVSASTWYHWAFTRSGNTGKMFLDGTQVGTTNSSMTNNFTDGKFRIASNHSGGELFTGYQFDVRMTKGYARYTANFTRPAAALEG